MVVERSLDLKLNNLEIKFKVLNSNHHKVYQFENFRLDRVTKLLFRDGEQITLTPKAVETLIALVESEGSVITKDELIQKIWADTIVEESNLAQYLHVLRKILGNTIDGKPYIETLKRRGYRFNGTVRVVPHTNGLSTVVKEPQSFHLEAENGMAKRTNPLSVRVERHGNVQAISKRASQPETRPTIKVERSDNIYSVSEWRHEPAEDSSLPAMPRTRSQWFSPLILLVLAAGFVGLGFGIYKFATSVQRAEERTIPFSETDMTRLTTSGRSKRSAISPDGRYVAHVMAAADGDSLWVRQVAVANDTRLAGPFQSSDLVWVTFAPDGNFVFYLALEKNKGETKLFRVPVLGGPTVKVLDDIAPPTFSPDGRRIAFMKTDQEVNRLFLAEADGTNETVLVSLRAPDYMNMFWNAPAWSLDGKSIAIPVGMGDEIGRYETVLAVDVEARATRKLSDTRWQQVGQPRWLSNGLVVTASENSTAPQQLWHISLPDGVASRITRDVNNYENLSLTLDATTLAVIQDHVVSNIWTMAGDATGGSQIMSEAGWLNEIVWLPDGRLAYTSRAGGSSDIWTMNADGSNIRQLTVGANARLGLSITADEKQIIFAAERDGKYNLWRVNIDGSNPEQITNGEGEYYPQCTPDGRWIVFQSGANYPTLWKMPIGGGEPTQLTKTTASRPSISPDGEFAAYHYLDSDLDGSRWCIGVIRLADGKRVKRFDFPSTVVERLVKWTRDGKAIAFLNNPGGIPNIWTQPLEGGDPKPLTDFRSESIITFNWTADGSSLAVIRGVKSSDILIQNRAKQ